MGGALYVVSVGQKLSTRSRGRTCAAEAVGMEHSISLDPDWFISFPMPVGDVAHSSPGTGPRQGKGVVYGRLTACVHTRTRRSKSQDWGGETQNVPGWILNRICDAICCPAAWRIELQITRGKQDSGNAWPNVDITHLNRGKFSAVVRFYDMC